jgi:NAD(P)-dependent dehydrogenase (short-subunit alcohol dehydrogenase family)
MMSAPDPVWESAVAVWAQSNVAVAHRLAKPEEIAAVALMMASQEYSFMNGAQIVVDGGKTTHA